MKRPALLIVADRAFAALAIVVGIALIVAPPVSFWPLFALMVRRARPVSTFPPRSRPPSVLVLPPAVLAASGIAILGRLHWGQRGPLLAGALLVVEGLLVATQEPSLGRSLPLAALGAAAVFSLFAALRPK